MLIRVSSDFLNYDEGCAWIYECRGRAMHSHAGRILSYNSVVIQLISVLLISDMDKLSCNGKSLSQGILKKLILITEVGLLEKDPRCPVSKTTRIYSLSELPPNGEAT